MTTTTGRRATTRARASNDDRSPRQGERVTIEYVMTLDDGTVVDDTRANGRGAATATLGDDGLFAPLAEALRGMKRGDKAKVIVNAKDAFGVRDENKITKFPLKPGEAKEMRTQVKPGQIVQLPRGQAAMCLALDDDGVTLDMNHPLAGQNLTFALELVDISAGITIFGTPMVALKM